MKRLGGLFSSLLLCLALAGCSLVKLRQESKDFYSSTVLAGRISTTARWDKPVVVAAYAKRGGRIVIVHHTFLHEQGSYELIVPKGEHRLFAFGDSNGNLTYDEGEPAGVYPAPIAAPGTGVIAQLDLLLTSAPCEDVPVGTAFSSGLSRRPHSTQIGAIADLDDPVFSQASGKHGYWAPMEFFKEVGGNVYFLEKYDPAKTPILFVHGAAGSPQDWRAFFDHIDRSRYQAWFFFYPSGAAVDSMAYLLFWKLFSLQLRYRFEKIYITAHSMGGLVVRSFLLNHGQLFPSVKLFLSISTPWGGEPLAEFGVKHSPAVIPSWSDMQPEGLFMRSLFARPLPPGIDYYLFFGHRGGYSLMRPSSDGTITVASQLRAPAQAEAKRIYGFDEDHVSILSSPQVLAQYRAVLSGKEQLAGPPAGAVRLRFSYDGQEGARPPPLLVLRPVEAGKATLTLALTARDSDQDIGPIPPGAYEASLLSEAYTTEPRKVRVRIGAGRTPLLGFRFRPQGVLSGWVGADGDAGSYPAGSYRPPHQSVKISSITLSGFGERRTLVPRRQEDGAWSERYAAGEDDAFGPFFLFGNLPQGEYELTIEAEGYHPYTARHAVVPGRQGQLRPIELSRLR